MVYYARRQQNIQQSRQKHTIKHKRERNTQKDTKVHETNYKNIIVSLIHTFHFTGPIPGFQDNDFFPGLKDLKN